MSYDKILDKVINRNDDKLIIVSIYDLIYDNISKHIKNVLRIDPKIRVNHINEYTKDDNIYSYKWDTHGFMRTCRQK